MRFCRRCRPGSGRVTGAGRHHPAPGGPESPENVPPVVAGLEEGGGAAPIRAAQGVGGAGRVSGAAGLRGAGCAGRAPREDGRAGKDDTAIKGSAPPVLCCWVVAQGRDGRSGMESGCSKEKRKRQTKSEAPVEGVSLPRLRRGSSGSRALPGWEAGLGAEDREGKGGSLLTGCRNKKNGGCLLPRCLLSARSRAGRAAAPAAETLSPGG